MPAATDDLPLQRAVRARLYCRRRQILRQRRRPEDLTQRFVRLLEIPRYDGTRTVHVFRRWTVRSGGCQERPTKPRGCRLRGGPSRHCLRERTMPRIELVLGRVPLFGGNVSVLRPTLTD